ncbi:MULTISPECIES: cache domain-containing protein [Massilia]|uniref:cache domain-containing protein n=1 Tax=Massilia TaxID=149698 RepID=UPI0014240917|nr:MULTISPECIES: cache domain-containing protein [unclassified Massilia]MDQ1835196.1 cache domain-containing protein [Massilia sp. CCM 9029]MDQ1925120.1 cache domain-containing protein [Massilia sp. CCM 9206]
MRFACALVLAGFTVVSSSHAETSQEKAAISLAERAAKHIHAVGIPVACKDFADPTKGYIDGELYVYIQDLKAKMICHPTNARLNGKDLLELKDADDKPFNKEMLEVLKRGRSGWVSYRWVHPVSKTIQPKKTYVMAIDGVMLGVGIYTK